MLGWFRDRAPLRRKLAVAASLQLVVLAGACAGLIIVLPSSVALTPVGLICAVAVTLSVTVSWLLSGAVATRSDDVLTAMERVASGDLRSTIPHVQTTDCMGRMARALTEMREIALDGIAAEADLNEARKLLDQERTARAVATTAQSDATGAMIAVLEAGMVRLTEGDLAYRIDQPFPAESERLRDAFNALCDHLHETMDGVGLATRAIRKGSRDILSAGEDLSSRVEQQAASLEETASALNQITATVNKTAEAARHASEVVSTAKSDAEKSGGIVQRAVQAMGGIEKSSRQIGQIIGAIDEIAFQTNLLALNAGVEAARAGDAGRGFAVVASEVRGLAQRSAEAAKEIKALVSASEGHVNEGVGLVGQAGAALGRIVDHVGEINTIVANIAGSVKDQAIGLQEINTAVAQMDSSTQQNAVMIGQSTQIAQALSQDAGDLMQWVRRFGAPRGARPEPASVTPLVRRSPKRIAEPVAALRTTAPRGSAVALKHRSAALEDSWEEF